MEKLPRSRKESLEFRGHNFEVTFYYYKDEDFGESYTTTETDTLWFNEIRSKYLQTLPEPEYPPKDERISIVWLPNHKYWGAFYGELKVGEKYGFGVTPIEALKDLYDEKNNQKYMDLS